MGAMNTYLEEDVTPKGYVQLVKIVLVANTATTTEEVVACAENSIEKYHPHTQREQKREYYTFCYSEYFPFGG